MNKGSKVLSAVQRFKETNDSKNRQNDVVLMAMLSDLNKKEAIEYFTATEAINKEAR